MAFLAVHSSPPWRWRVTLSGVLRLAVAFALSLTALGAPAPPQNEAEVKADYLYLFTKYVDWPEGALAGSDKPMVVGVIGDEAVGEAAERRVHGRPTQGGRIITVLRARRAADLVGCHVVFVGQGEKRGLREITEAMRGRPALTVCDADGLFGQGFMIKFGLVEGTVRFEVKLDPVERSGLSIHAGMLGAAKKVYPKARTSLEPP